LRSGDSCTTNHALTGFAVIEVNHGKARETAATMQTAIDTPPSMK